MKLGGKLESDLSRLVEIISSFREVIGVILFGSIARGDFDEYSDYDILVIFKDKGSMWSRWDDLFKAVGKLKLLIHMIPKSFDEFLNSEPTFLNEIYKDGMILYAKYPFPAFLRPLNQWKLIVYDLSMLEQRDKMKILYKLYGKRKLGKYGLLEMLGGRKLGDGCIIIPAENLKPILEIFKQFNVKIKILDFYTFRPK